MLPVVAVLLRVSWTTAFLWLTDDFTSVVGVTCHLLARHRHVRYPHADCVRVESVLRQFIDFLDTLLASVDMQLSPGDTTSDAKGHCKQ